MNIVIATSEAVPFAKTGGLADVCGSLSLQLRKLGHNVTVIMPAFRQVFKCGLPIEPTEISFPVAIAGKSVSARILRSHLPDSDCEVLLVDQPVYFDREGLYGDAQGDYWDNCERFAFFCRAALSAIDQLDSPPDIVHCNDWQTGLIPAYIANRFDSHPWMMHATSVMTIHNMAYQGQFWHWDMLLTGLGWDQFTPDKMEFYGHLNLLKTGIVFADAITTVSERYAQEIQQPDHGCGLDGVLRLRRHLLTGIVNGVDDQIWNPATDPHLESNYDIDNWKAGKHANRSAIRTEFGLDDDPDLPLIGLVGRLAEQKGWDLVTDLMNNWLGEGTPAQWIVLGTGDLRYHQTLSELAARFGKRLAVHLGFSDRLAHRIEAAADIFLMPSRYEPCGLNQLYSLRYGAIPVVNPTGGLADTVVDATEQSIHERRATGFYMHGYHTRALGEALDRAVSLYRDHPTAWEQLVLTGMRQDWSWKRSAVRYEQLYQETIERERSYVAPGSSHHA
ncbi:MAG: glycogen synthase GlgA [Pirellulaceae bacterium]